MFDEMVAEASHGMGSVGAWARVENAACARRLGAMVTLLDARRAADGSAEREQWYLDNWAAVCAQIGASQQITSGAASHQLLIATALRDRLPRVAAAFAEGSVSYATVSVIVWRTATVTDPDAMRTVDGMLATALRDWEPMSHPKLSAAVDHWVHRVDPHAVRRTQTQARSRGLHVSVDDASGLGTVWGTLFAHDAMAFDARLDAVAATVCDRDPRTGEQRRADAVGALGVGADRMRCLCAATDCPAGDPQSPVAPVVVYLIAHEDTLSDDSIASAAHDAALDGPNTPDLPDSGLPRQPCGWGGASPWWTGRRPVRPAPSPPGAVMGGPALAGPLLRRAAAAAAIRRVVHPGAAPPELRYRPSRKLAEFVRCRDLTCRFPGCDVPATDCDVDHTIPYPMGPTQASNLKALCRRHHLLKTFWGGKDGWCEQQSPDGTVAWTAPTGQEFITRPGSRVPFPSLCRPTAPSAPRAGDTVPRTAPTPGLTMPRRHRTRAEDRTRRTSRERRENEVCLSRMGRVGHEQ